MTSKIKSFDTPQDVANAFAERLIELLNQAKDAGTTATVCLSGGSTPKLLFKTLAKDHADIDWSPLHFFWGDERCVPADSGESNYGEADRLFLRDANIPAENIHAVNTSLAPGSAADDYQRQIEAVVAKDSAGKPAFDLMVLGMGDDGHTASIFPHQMELLTSDKTCEVATHPDSGQKRITITGNVINAAKQIHFLVTGTSKEGVVKEIFSKTENYNSYPASHIKNAKWWLDEAAT